MNNNQNKPRPVNYTNQFIIASVLTILLIIVSLVIAEEYKYNFNNLSSGFILLKSYIGTFLFLVGIFCSIKAILLRITFPRVFSHASIAMFGLSIITNSYEIIYSVLILYIAILTHDYFIKRLQVTHEPIHEENV